MPVLSMSENLNSLTSSLATGLSTATEVDHSDYMHVYSCDTSRISLACQPLLRKERFFVGGSGLQDYIYIAEYKVPKNPFFCVERIVLVPHSKRERSSVFVV